MHPVTGVPYSDKQKLIAGLLNILLPFGIGRFYIGDTGTGVAQLLVSIFTCGIGALWSFIDGILMLTGDPNDSRAAHSAPDALVVHSFAPGADRTACVSVVSRHAIRGNCSGGPADPWRVLVGSAPKEPKRTATSATPTATPPTMPAQAKEDTPEGAAAFVKHYIDVFNYAASTGDVEELSRLSSPTARAARATSSSTEDTYKAGGYFKDEGLGDR